MKRWCGKVIKWCHPQFSISFAMALYFQLTATLHTDGSTSTQSISQSLFRLISPVYPRFFTQVDPLFLDEIPCWQPPSEALPLHCCSLQMLDFFFLVSFLVFFTVVIAEPFSKDIHRSKTYHKILLKLLESKRGLS